MPIDEYAFKADTLYSYHHTRDGQLTAGQVKSSPWISTEGYSQIVCISDYAGGTTNPYLYVAWDPEGTLSWNYAGIAASGTGTVLNVAHPFIQVRFQQVTADSTVARFAMKARL